MPYYLPVFFPAGAAVFHIFRVARIFCLFQINAYYSAMNVITEVLNSKRQQLASSVFIILVPRGDAVLRDNDILILGAGALKDDKHIDLKEIVLRKKNPWNGRLISELDISRQTIIVMVKRNGTMLITKGNLMLLEGDHVILYSQTYIADAEQISI